MPPLIDVLVPNYMTADLLLAGIVEPLREHWDNTLNLIICDDASPQDDRDVLKSRLNVSHLLIQNHERLGPAQTFNLLVRSAGAPISFLCNSDIIIPRVQTLYDLANTLEKLGPHVIIGTAEGPRFFDNMAQPYTIQPTPERRKACPQDYTSACAMMWRRQELTGTTLFDSSFCNGYYEDSDACYRLRCNGWKTYYATSSIAHIGQQAMIRLQTQQPELRDRLTMFAAIETNRQIFLDRWGRYMRPKVDNLEIAIQQHEEVNEMLRKDATP